MARHPHDAAAATHDPTLDIPSPIDVTFLLLICFPVSFPFPKSGLPGAGASA
ncbi:MAG: hypothetical protein NTW21_15740 [Verrucomicrobia bacterium]|nr:hypothetical protein [Verrucomicrobiota bacterium]